jgi:hypothetical protein
MGARSIFIFLNKVSPSLISATLNSDFQRSEISSQIFHWHNLKIYLRSIEIAVPLNTICYAYSGLKFEISMCVFIHAFCFLSHFKIRIHRLS